MRRATERDRPGDRSTLGTAAGRVSQRGWTGSRVSRRASSRGALVALLAAGLTLAITAVASAAGVEPSSYSGTLSPGSSVTITKTVNTPAIPANPDIVFLSDTTGSMFEAIGNVRSNAGSIMGTVASAQPTAEFAAADYKDGSECPEDPYAFKLDQALTSSISNVEAGIATWSAAGGCDYPESQVNALYELATNPSVGFRSGSTRIVVWFGDAPGHDPDLGHTLAEAISALVAAKIHVIAVPIVDAYGNGLDETGQGTEVAEATGGEVLPSATPEEVSAAILKGLEDLPVTIKPTPSCESGLSATYDAAEKTVTSGSSATFEETIMAAPSASGTLKCTVDFLLNGVHVEGFQQTVTIAVPTGPEVDEWVQGKGPNTKTVELSTKGSKDLIVAFVQADGPYNGGASQTLKVSGGGLTWKFVGRENKGLGDAEIWVAEASSALSKAPITVAANVTTPGSPKGHGYETAITVVAFKNATGYGAVTTTGSKVSSEPRASLTTKYANSWVWASGNDWLKAITHVPGPGQEIFQAQLMDPVGDTYWVQRESSLTSKAGTKVTINDKSPTTDVWNLVLIEIH